jgi:hypothetical protein
VVTFEEEVSQLGTSPHHYLGRRGKRFLENLLDNCFVTQLCKVCEQSFGLGE